MGHRKLNWRPPRLQDCTQAQAKRYLHYILLEARAILKSDMGIELTTANLDLSIHRTSIQSEQVRREVSTSVSGDAWSKTKAHGTRFLVRAYSTVHSPLTLFHVQSKRPKVHSLPMENDLTKQKQSIERTLGCMTEDKPQAKNGTRSPSFMPAARSTPRSVAARSAYKNSTTGKRGASIFGSCDTAPVFTKNKRSRVMMFC